MYTTMPSAAEIVEGLAELSHAQRPAAMLWHGALLVLLVALAFGVRPRQHHARVALAAPLASVSVFAWSHQNPFNGMVFGLAAALLATMGAYRPSKHEVARAPLPWAAAGVGMIAFGWLYPHFHDASTGWRFLIDAPLGVIPCPTLSAVVGLALLGGGLGSFAWSLALSALGLFYGLFGAGYLGVPSDWVLSAGSVLLAWKVFAGQQDGR